ncbi:MAG: O-antigen ligase domain-containing protein [Actinobacteria bacterium]|nr:O-antigen ligase domain-containing protein [Actinomycetota bacterium]
MAVPRGLVGTSAFVSGLVGWGVATKRWIVVAAALGAVLLGVGAAVPGVWVSLLLAVAPMNKAFGESGPVLGMGLFALTWVATLGVVAAGATQDWRLRFPLAAPIAALLLLSALAVVRAAPLIVEASERWTFGFVKPAMYMSMVWLGASAWKGKRAFPFFGVVAGIVLLMAVSVYMQRLGLYEHPFSPYTSSIPEKRIGGFLASANEMGRFLSVYLALLLPGLSGSLRRWERVLVASAQVVGVPTLVLTLNRGGIVAYAVALGVWVLWSGAHSQGRRALLLTAVAVLAVSVTVLPQVAEYYSVYAEGVRSGDWGLVTQGRDAIWLGVWRYVRDPVHLWFGGGMSDYTYHIREYVQVDRLFAVHNTYLRVLVESGLVGLVVVGWLAVSAVRLVLRRMREDPRDTALPRGVLLALIAAGAVGLTGDFGVGSSQMAILWFAVGLSASSAAGILTR